MSLEDRIRLPTLNLIHRRPRLIKMLENFIESGYRFVAIYAPGGYGKSILLADFTQTTNLPVCWCSLESSDRDPTSFLTLLAYSITDRFHEIDAESLFKLVERGDTQNSVRRIATLLNDVGPHLIIIDDYHKAVSAGVTLALNQLLDQLPETSTIIVAARGDMELETGQIIDLLMAERATGLSEEELRFTPEEVQLMMRKRFGRRIDLETAAEIVQSTDGNIAQILLTGHMMKTDQTVGSLKQRLGDDHEVIYQYLATEVFDKHSPKLQRFMLHTAVLPDMTVELCNDLLDISDAQTYIEALVYNDLFVAQIGGGFRYHDLFAEFLRAKLAEDPPLYYWVSAKAAQLLTDQSRFEEAIPLYLGVQTWDKAASLLEAHGRRFYNTGRALTLNGWFNEIPEQELSRYPQLLLLWGQILGNDLGELDQAQNLFKQAEQQFQQKNNLIGIAEAQIQRAAALRMMGYPNEALILATKGLNQLDALNAEKSLVAYAIRSRGMAYLFAGNVVDALSDLRRALKLFEQLGDAYTIASCHHEIGICLERQGNIGGAEHHYIQAFKTWEALGNANDLANTLNSLGVCAYLRADYDEALERFHNSLEIALQIGATRRAAFAQTGLGDVYLERQDYEQAIAAYELSTQFAQEVRVRSLEIYNLVKVGEISYRQHNAAQALQLAIQAEEIATETGLSIEKGLSLALQGKIHARRAEYEASFKLFAEAIACFGEGVVLEQVKTRLWWGYSLLLDLRASAAFEQLQEAINLILTIGELVRGLGPTVNETHQLLLHFLHRVDTPAGMRDSIRLLLAQGKSQIEPISPRLQVFAFGVPYLIVADRLRQFHQRGGTRKSPEFLLYLLLEGQGGGCRWSEMAADLWPDLKRATASSHFHQNMKQLRDTVFGESDYIMLRDDYYIVNPDYLEWCDALAFEKLFERVVRTHPNEALPLQLELISLYRGEFLAGFEVSEWGAARRALYEGRFFQIVKQAGEQLLKDDMPRETLAVVNKGLALDYFREDLHRSALKAYDRLGLFDDLEAHYFEMCQIIERELETPPEPDTEQLYRRLMAKKLLQP